LIQIQFQYGVFGYEVLKKNEGRVVGAEIQSLLKQKSPDFSPTENRGFESKEKCYLE